MLPYVVVRSPAVLVALAGFSLFYHLVSVLPKAALPSLALLRVLVLQRQGGRRVLRRLLI